MGWSCTAAASKTLDKWRDLCRENTGLSNFWRDGGKEFFCEAGDEQDDGAIVGDVFLSLGDHHCRRVSGFRIEPDGTVSEAPRFLRKEVQS